MNVAGRHVTLDHTPASTSGRRGRFWLMPLAALAILAVGIGIGSRLGEHGDMPSQTTTSTPSAAKASTPDPGSQPAPVTEALGDRTEAGAAAAAANAITAFDPAIVLDETRLRETVSEVAARDFRDALLETYRRGAPMLRERLAIDSTPKPVFFVRTSPVGYRVESYSREAATVSVWTVGVVGSGATVQPQQTWDTQRVDLIWETGAWKVTRFESHPGPTPPLARAEAADTPSTLFQAVPTFQPFRHATP